MIQIDGVSLQQKVKETREFMGQNFPSLVVLVDESVAKVVDLYSRAGSPNGFSADASEMEDKALEWFGRQYTHLQEEWQESHPATLSVEERATLEAFQQELIAIGDAIKKDGKVELTPKAMARWLYYQLGDWIDHAEQEKRGFSVIELEKLAYATGVVHTLTRGYLD